VATQFLESAVILAFLFLAARAAWRRGAFWGTLILVPILMAMASGTLLSLARIALGAYPTFIDVAQIIRQRRVFLCLLVMSVLLQMNLLYRYVNWWKGA
jgi:hypothetical protein